MIRTVFWSGTTREFIESLHPNNEDSILKNYYHLLQAPMFTPRSTLDIIEDLTYRKINEWDTKNFIKASREKKEGWRRFSFIEVIKLRIITELRTFGLDADRIRKFLDLLFFSDDDVCNKIETHICACLEGHRIYIIADDIDNIFFRTQDELVKDFFPLEYPSSAILILPFHSYVQDIAAQKINPKESQTLNNLLTDEKEKTILDIIRNQKFIEIIIRRNNKNIHIKAKSVRDGKPTDEELLRIIKEKAYQTVSVKTEGKEIVGLVQEENIKI